LSPSSVRAVGAGQWGLRGRSSPAIEVLRYSTAEPPPHDDMERTFRYAFTPASSDPVGAALVRLSVSDIEDAALREILQTPGAGLATWSLLDALLTSTGPNTPFVFREPLGQAREVKVALSGLFGRFVARAYLERYHGLSIFAHLGAAGMLIDARRRISAVRTARGDLPDWEACSAGWKDLTIAEAKGCHDRPGPAKALDRAWKQRQRVNIICRSLPVTVKRIAVATRWGSAKGGASTPMMSVLDPEDTGAALSRDEKRALFVGLLRKHLATLLAPLAHAPLSEALRKLTSSRLSEKALTSAALAALDASPVSNLDTASQLEDLEPMLGGLTTRQGVVSNTRPSRSDEQALVRLQLRPQFVGVERRVIRAAILGAELGAVDDAEGGRRRGRARGDGVGVWIVPLFGEGPP